MHDLAWHRVQSHTRSYARTYFGTLQARAYKHAAAIVCDSNFSATEYRDLIEPRPNVDVVYPGVDERFAHIERRPDTSPFALVAGTVEARKNLLVLIEALPSLPTLRIISVGPPTPYADTVRARAAELHVADRVELRGYVDREQLDDLYARATCALIPSRYEGFGYALAEAMCAGIPAIAARSSSLIEVADNAVPLIAPDDTSAWIEAIRTLLADRDAAQHRADALRERMRSAVCVVDRCFADACSLRSHRALLKSDRGGPGGGQCCDGDAPSSASCASGHSVLRSLPPSGLRSLRNAPPQHRPPPTLITITARHTGTMLLCEPGNSTIVPSRTPRSCRR